MSPQHLAALLFFTGLIPACPTYAVEDAETDYIIKYKESAAWLMADDSVPFEVVNRETMERLRSLGLLEWYEPDGVGELMEETAELLDSSFYESFQWNLDVVQAEGAFQKGRLGGGVRVGVIDSGVNPHADLKTRLLTGCNYIEGAADLSDTADGYGHGTAVAGLIAGAGAHGCIGTAPAAEIVPLKITDGKAVKVSAICRAIYGGINEYGCNVLNLSLGVTGEFQSLREAVDYAEAQNVLLVSAVGNSGRTNIYYPAGYETVIGVGAVDRYGEISSRSNHNSSVLLTAPGIDVRSTDASGGYSLHTGTSFAAPQAAGAAAVLLGIDPTLTPAELRSLLALSAADRGAEGYDEYYGYGILNVAGSIAALMATRRPEPRCSFLPDTGPATELRNNTDAPVSVAYLLAAYDENGRCLDVHVYALTVPAHDVLSIESPAENTRYGQFICEAETMVPLIPGRKTP